MPAEIVLKQRGKIDLLEKTKTINRWYKICAISLTLYCIRTKLCILCKRDAKVLTKSANYVDSLQQAIAPIFSHRLWMWWLHCNENSIYVFLNWELRGLSLNFHIHVSLSDLYIPRNGPHIFLCALSSHRKVYVESEKVALWTVSKQFSEVFLTHVNNVTRYPVLEK